MKKVVRFFIAATTMLLQTTLHAQTKMPDASEWYTGNLTAPGEPYSLDNYINKNYVRPAGSPTISGWNDNVIFPGESFTLTGDQFTTRKGDSIYSDATVWIYSQNGGSGLLSKCEIYKIDDKVILAGIPANLNFGLYTIWVENQKGISAPIILNRPKSVWVGPMGKLAEAGDTMRVFGKNFTTGHDTTPGSTRSFIFMQASSGGTATPLTVIKAEPYCVWYKVPANAASGNYKVYVHSGHGASYGFSAGLDLVIGTRWKRSTASVTVNISGGNDAGAIQSAIDQMSANANGGTVILKAGTYQITQPITLKPGVCIKGAGMNSTTLNIAMASKQMGGILLYGSNSTLQNFTLHQTNNLCDYGPTKEAYGQTVYNISFIGMRFSTALLAPLDARDMLYQTQGGEITGCEFNYQIRGGFQDVWIHNNLFYGGQYYSSEAAINGGGAHLILELNHFETKWPTGSNFQYMTAYTFDQYQRMIWCKRILVARGNSSRSYIAHNTTKDVAVDDNKGEILLFHGGPSGWYAEVSSATATTLTMSTSGAINGIVTKADGKAPATSIPNQIGYDNPDWLYCVIIDGKGKGQYRKIKSHTASMLTLTEAWRVIPDNTSRFTITGLYTEHIIYKNDLNAFPQGYKLSYSASVGIDFDANSMNNVTEGNVSRRTYMARRICGNNTGPSYWNDFRNENAYDNYLSGYDFTVWYWSGSDDHALGAAMLGNRISGGEITLDGSNTVNAPWSVSPALGNGSPYWPPAPNILTNHVTSGIYQNVKAAGYPAGVGFNNNSSILVSNCNFTLKDDPAKPNSRIGSTLGTTTQSVLLGNTYANATKTYSNSYTRIAPLYRTLHYYPDSKGVTDTLYLPIGNGGSAPLTFTITPGKTWIHTSVVSITNLQGEVISQVLKVWVDSKTMNTTIANEGLITLTGGGEIKTVGVYVAIANAITHVSEIRSANDMVVYPNPSSRLSVISYQLSENSNVNIFICDVLGKEVMQVINEKQSAGEHFQNINTEKLQSGNYFVKMNVNGEQVTHKLIVNK